MGCFFKVNYVIVFTEQTFVCGFFSVLGHRCVDHVTLLLFTQLKCPNAEITGGTVLCETMIVTIIIIIIIIITIIITITIINNNHHKKVTPRLPL